MTKKGPCTCWLVFDTNFSGAGIWCVLGMNFVTGDYSSFGTMHSHPYFCICPSSTWAGITSGIIFSSVVILLVVHPLRSSPGRLRCSLLFHQADQAAPEAQISLLSVAQRRSGILSYSWRTFLGSWPRSFSAAPFPIPVAPPYDPVGRSDR